MDVRAVVKAESRLKLAERAAADLDGLKHDDFSDRWYEFLVALKNVWTVLEQGAKTTPQSRQWYGTKAAERRGDELLQYLYEARNDDEHGLEPVVKFAHGYTAIGVNKQGFSQSMRFDGVIGGPAGTSLKVTSLDGKPVLVEQAPDRTLLASIRPRGRPEMQPPQKHLGKELLDDAPTAVANHALDYMRQLVAEARSRTA